MVEHNQSQYYGNQYKFNGKELDAATGMYYYGARYYDPRLSIFISVDPLAEQTFEPYSYVGNNPIMFTDPTGMSKDGVDGTEDRITVNNHGIVTDVVKNNELNTFFDEDGNELKYNDTNDSPLLIKEFKVGDRLYEPISKKVFSNVMKDAGEIKFSDSFFGKIYFNIRNIKAAYYEYDFAFSFFQHHFQISDKSMSELLWGSGFVNSVPFIRFEGSNTLYNVPDAGNFMWGHRGFLNGAPLNHLLDAANKNEGGSDTTGDQNAIRAGYYYRTK